MFCRWRLCLSCWGPSQGLVAPARPASPLLAKPQKSVSHCPAPCLSERAPSAAVPGRRILGWRKRTLFACVRSGSVPVLQVPSLAAHNSFPRFALLPEKYKFSPFSSPQLSSSLFLFSPPPKFLHTHIQVQLSASGGRQDVLNNPFPPVSPVQPSRFRPRT